MFLETKKNPCDEKYIGSKLFLFIKESIVPKKINKSGTTTYR